MTDDAPKLTKKQQVFIDEYLKCFNGAEAARRAGYSKHSARQTASDLLAETYISEQIQARLAEVHMSADEALQRIAEIARGDIGDFMAINSMGFELDLEAAREAQKTGVIKRVRQTVITVNGEKEDKETITTDIELHDKLSALRDILKIHGRFGASVELSEGVEIVIRKASDAAGTNNK
jgi:phage terminase small subunit